MVTIRHAGDGLTRLSATGLVLLGMILLAGCQHASMSIAAQPASTTDHIAPEHTHQITQREAVSAKEFLVASAHPLASNAAYAVLEKGGTAIDAMVTVQTVLGLVEPQSSGLGGGAFLLYYDARNQQLYSVDGRETAPLAAPDDLFIRPDQSPMSFFEAVVGGRSVGTPGTVALLWNTHQQFGTLPWAQLIQPAIDFAQAGFHVTPRLSSAVKHDAERLNTDPEAQAYFFPDGQAIETGDLLKNPDYANTLNLLARHGGPYFYSDDFARHIVSKVQNAANPGYLSLKDFRQYRAIQREPICHLYLEHKVCGMGPPSSGAISVSQILGITENFDLEPETSESWHIISEAARLAFADRGLYLADPDFVPPPNGLLQPEYLASRASLINTSQALDSVFPGMPEGLKTSDYHPGKDIAQPSTSHFVIVDRYGNIVSMTSTIENGFGSRLMTQGFLLNNELTDFSFVSEKQGMLVANRVAPGKRPRSSMAPTIVFKNDRPVYALGSPGGSRIINYVANSLIRLIAWQTPIQEAFDRPHIVNRFGQVDLEKNEPVSDLAEGLAQKGHDINIRDLNSGLHGIAIEKEQLIGAADKRREGLVLGQ